MSHAAIWREWRALTTAGFPVKYSQEILAFPVLLPKKMSVIPCPGHQKGDDTIARKNQATDKAAKKSTMREFLASPLLYEEP
jgi:hypothetical protein